MLSSLRFQSMHKEAFTRNANWFLCWGIILAALGIAAIAADTLTTLITVVILGFLIFFSGCVMMLDTITFWRDKSRSFFLHFLISLLYIAVGLVIINNPEQGAISLTLIIGIFYLVAGIFRLTLNVLIRMPRWGWGFFNGLISLLLGILILNSWPESSIFVIALFVGIDIFFTGWFYIMAALAAKSLK